MSRFSTWAILTIAAFGSASAWLIAARTGHHSPAEKAENVYTFNVLEYNLKTPQVFIEEIEKRPLFQPTRQVPPSSLTASSPSISQTNIAPPEPSNVVLHGTIIDSQNRIALVKSGGDNVSRTLREGEMLNGWQIETIQKDSILLRSGSEQREIHIPQAPSLQPTTP